jgi:hypothetical protein
LFDRDVEQCVFRKDRSSVHEAVEPAYLSSEAAYIAVTEDSSATSTVTAMA